MLDQFACGLAAFPGFRERNSRVFAKRKHAGLAIQCEAVSPSLDSVGLDFEVEPALVIQAVELFPGLGVAAVRVGKHVADSLSWRQRHYTHLFAHTPRAVLASVLRHALTARET
ncbi:hypothetical protein D9M70_585110 [compost metagenome]